MASNINLNSTSVGMVMDLISEGPIRLKNGLNSIFLNGTPISNKDAKEQGLTYNGAPVFANSDGTEVEAFRVVGSYSDGKPYPVLLIGAAAKSTVSASVGDTTITTDTSFFQSSWVGFSPSVQEVLPKLRIEAGRADGTVSVHYIVSYTSATQAEISPAIQKDLTSANIYFDLSTTGVASLGAVTNATIRTQKVTFALEDTIPRTDLYNDLTTGTYSDWTSIESLIMTSSDMNDTLRVGTGLNFSSVKANFREGAQLQDPVKLSNFSSGTTTTIAPGVELQQVTSIEDESGTTLTIHNTRKKKNKENTNLGNVKPDTGAGATILDATTGTNGFNLSNPGAVDSIDLTINFPSGLYAQKANADGDIRDNGVCFRIVLKHKTSNEATYRRKLLLGPKLTDISPMTSLMARAVGLGDENHRYTGSGLFFAEDTDPGSIDIHLDLKPFQPFDHWQIEISKVTPDSFTYDSDKWSTFGTTILATASANIEDKFRYPYSAYAAIEFGSNEFQGKFPERKYHCLGVECSVPTNYVTREEAIDGVAAYTRSIITGAVGSSYVPWDGSFRRAYTNNPVWCLREVLLNKRWGLGEWMTASEINDYSLYSLARYCDELVPDGKGGLEPRFTCGVYLTQPTEAYKVIKDFCSIMLALPYWVDGQLILEGDRPSEPVYTFTKGNIIDGVFSYEGTGNRTRINQVAVTFNDKDNFYEQAVELIDDIENIIATNRLNTSEVVAFGATSRSQAIRYGKWKLLTSKLQKEIINFKTAENASYIKPGSVILVQDADKERVRQSGRTRADSTGTTINLDDTVTLTSPYTYDLHLIVPGSVTYLLQESATISIGGTPTAFSYGDIITGVTTEESAEVLVDTSGNPVEVQFSPDVHIETRTVTSTGTTNSPVVSSAFSVSIPKDSVWALTVKDGDDIVEGSPKEYKVLAVSEESPGVYGITAAEHFNSKFDLIDEDYLSEAPDYQPRDSSIPPVTELTGNAILIPQGDGFTNNSAFSRDIKLSWVSPDSNPGGLPGDKNYDSIIVYSLDESFSPVTLPDTATSVKYNNVGVGTYSFGIQAKSSVGPASKMAEITVTVDDTLETPGIDSIVNMPVGGTFNRPLIISGSNLTAPSNYTFTSPKGKETTVGS
jgi:hypothetical protein